MKQPHFSIIIVVRNGAGTIEAALSSVFTDNDPELVECIVIDGGSTDGTLDIVKRYENKIARWISEPDRGIFDAMNKGVASASGRFVYFLGCDDILVANLLALRETITNAKTIYYGDVVKDAWPRPYDGKFSRWKLSRMNICHQSMFYPSSAFEHGGYRIDYPSAADWEFNLRCAGSPGIKFQYIPVVIARFAEGGASATPDFAFRGDYLRLVKKHLPLRFYLGLLAFKLWKRIERVVTAKWQRMVSAA